MAGRAARGEPVPGLPKVLDAPDSLGPASVTYPLMVYLDVPSVGANVALVAGALALVQSIDPTARVVNWSTRFQVIFSEYCIVGIKFCIRNGNRGAGAVDGGTTEWYLDESSSAAPTANQALAHPRISLLNVGIESGRREIGKMSWMAADFQDLSWSDTAVASTPVYIKGFTNNANFATPAASTQNWYIDWTYRIAFRGLRA